MRLVLSIAILITLFSSEIKAQLPTGHWRTHFSYREVQDLLLDGDDLYVLSSQGLFIYNTLSGSIQTISTVSGLRRSSITALGRFGELVALGYEDGSVDIFDDGQLIALSEIRNSTFDDKQVNHIITANERVYISTNFGIVVYESQNRQVLDTWWQLGAAAESAPIQQTLIRNDSIYAVYNSRLIRGSLDSQTNLSDFTNWFRYAEVDPIIDLAEIQGQLFSLAVDGLYRVNENDWVLEGFQGEVPLSMVSEGSSLIICAESAIFEFDGNVFTEFLSTGDLIINCLVRDQDRYYYGSSEYGVLNNSLELSSSIVPEGPDEDENFSLESAGASIFVLGGSWVNSQIPLNKPAVLSEFKDQSWEGFSTLTGDFPSGSQDILDVATISESSFLLALYEQGLLITGENEQLISNAQGFDFSTVMQVEPYGPGFWILLNDGFNRLIYTEDFIQFGGYFIQSGITTERAELLVDRDWVYILERGTFSRRLTVLNKENGQIRVLDQSANNGSLAGSPQCMILDRRGDLWVGTDDGITVVSNINLGGTVISYEPIIEGVPLFRNTGIISIAVDSGNRKWVGTSEGAFLIDEFGDRNLNFFNISNSPLPSNVINDIEIQDITGEVFFLTPNGLIGYGGKASSEKTNYSTARIFPNPAYPEKSLYLTIDGLMFDSELKITTVSGDLVWSGFSNGGRVVWDFNNLRGELAAPGVYFVFAVDEQQNERYSGKFVLLR